MTIAVQDSIASLVLLEKNERRIEFARDRQRVATVPDRLLFIVRIQFTHANDDLIILASAGELPHHFLQHLTA